MSTRLSIADSHSEMESFHGLVYASPAMRFLIARLLVVAETDEVVCILGESGTGKELVARAVHEESRRRGKPFVAFNCSALSRDLIESRLFGHRRGSFTGAYADHQGVIASASGGSVFLDEIGDLAFEAQGALLRFLNNGEIQAIGAPRPVIANVRVITATNRDLRSEVEAGRFRKDLYYRLDVGTLLVPPLRSRPEDVTKLAYHFSALYSSRYTKQDPGFTCEDIARLVGYQWPGNVRELESCIKRFLLFGELDIQENPSQPRERDQVWRNLSESEKVQRMITSLEDNGWNVTVAANKLGICRRTVQRALRRQLKASPTSKKSVDVD